MSAITEFGRKHLTAKEGQVVLAMHPVSERAASEWAARDAWVDEEVERLAREDCARFELERALARVTSQPFSARLAAFTNSQPVQRTPDRLPKTREGGTT